MMKEISREEAMQAVVDGKKVIRYSESSMDHSGTTLSLTPEVNSLFLEDARYLLDEPDAPGPAADEKPKHKGGRPSRVDIGKIQALYNAGWSIKKISEEMGVTQETIKRHLLGNRGGVK